MLTFKNSDTKSNAGRLKHNHNSVGDTAKRIYFDSHTKNFSNDKISSVRKYKEKLCSALSLSYPSPLDRSSAILDCFIIEDDTVIDSKCEIVHWIELNSELNKIKEIKCTTGGRNRRAKAFGLQFGQDTSFETNQSFPKRSNRFRQDFIDTSFVRKTLVTMDKIKDDPNDLRFSARRTRGGFTLALNCPLAGGSSGFNVNPNKAVFTIDSKTSMILIVNSNACNLLGYSSKELCDMHFFHLLLNKNKSHISALAEGQLNSDDGSVVLLSGKVVEMSTKSGKSVAVSLWIRQLEQNRVCLAMAEPVQRRVAQLVIDKTGCVMSGDAEAAMLFQCDAPDMFNGIHITSLIPSIILPELDMNIIPKFIRKQKATGKSSDGSAFPLCLVMSQHDINAGTPDTILYVLKISVFSNLSGLMVIDDKGIVGRCNHYFSMLLFGQPQDQVIGEKITNLIPQFGEDSEYLGLNHTRNITMSSFGNMSDTETDPILSTNDLNSPFHKSYSCDEHSQTSIQSSLLNRNITIPKIFSQTNYQALNDLSLYKKVPELISSENSENDINLPNMAKENKLFANSTIPQYKPLQNMFSGDNCTEVIDLVSPDFKDVKPLMLCTIPQYKPLQKMFSGDNCTEVIDLVSPDIKDVVKPLMLCTIPQYKPLQNMFPGDNCTEVIDLVSPDIKEVVKPLMHIDLSDGSAYNDDELLTPVNVQIDRKMQSKSNEEFPVLIQCRDTSESSMKSELKDKTGELLLCHEAVMTPPASRRCVELAMGRKHMATSTPEVVRRPSEPELSPQGQYNPHDPYRAGCYKGVGLHRDGNNFDISYIVSHQTLACGRSVCCVWVSSDAHDQLESANLTLTSSITSTVDTSLGQAIKFTAAQNLSQPASLSLMSHCEEEQTSGEYCKDYTTLQQIGKGAYGSVKMAYRNRDKLLVIAKFILKDRVNDQFWIYDNEMGKEVPLEVSLLTTLQHPNIVTVLDVYENDKFFQLIMEKHGSGMDLFDFIERRPNMDEPLISYIFRQIAKAVEYLHSLHILHRDIKDENIIIDENFHVKLIDFGSATFFREGTLFSTFYGTTEYCSPEVLSGNKYAGPELEMWSMGVTLYVLTFEENPFIDINETLQADLVLPVKISTALEKLLLWMLEKDPKKRATMSDLMAAVWLHQTVDIANYQFSQVIGYDTQLAKPDQYYAVDTCSSTGCLSSGPVSPRDVVSLIDDDSLVEEYSSESGCIRNLHGRAEEHNSEHSLQSKGDSKDLETKSVLKCEQNQEHSSEVDSNPSPPDIWQNVSDLKLLAELSKIDIKDIQDCAQEEKINSCEYEDDWETFDELDSFS